MRMCLRSIAAAWSVCLLFAPGPARASDQPVLRVADQKGLVRALLEASHALDGIAYRIDWSDFPAASPLLQALGAGAVDTGIAGDGPFLFAFGAGLPVRATMALLPRYGGRAVAVMVPAGSTMHAAADLAGRRIATTRGSIGHALLLRLEQTGRIRGGGISLVYLLPAQAAAALHAGSIDGWATWEPYIAIEEQHGARRVVDGSDGLANYAFQVANLAAIGRKHALLQDFYRRMSRAYDWGNLHPALYAALWSAQMGLAPDLSRRIADEMRTHAIPIGPLVIDAERATIDSYRKGGILPPRGADIDAAFDRSFAQ